MSDINEIKRIVNESRVHGVYNWNLETIASLITTIESQNSQIENDLKSSAEILIINEKQRGWIIEKDALIESQKEEIERNMLRIESYEQGLRDRDESIESLKAITELAVPALKWYADKKNWNLGVSISMGSAFPLHEAIKSDKGKIAVTTLSEIERLQNEQT